MIERIGIACDCHNTLINSNPAWIKAFTDYVGLDKEDEIRFYLYGKMKRRELAAKYGIKFELIENRADLYEKPNTKVIEILGLFKNIGIPLFIISNAPARRVLKDLSITGIISMFDRVYTGDDGGKKNLNIIDNILSGYSLERLLFLGNEEFDDHIPHDKVVSVALTSFLRDRYSVIKGFNVDENGKVKENVLNG